VFDSANATPIAVAAGTEVTGINLTMRKTTTVHVKGVVSNIPAGNKQPVQVLLVPRGRGGFIGGPRNFAAAKGSFELRGVTPGQYSLAAMLNEEGQNYSAFMPLDVGSSNLENLNLSLSAGVDIPGKIRIEGDGQQSIGTVNVNLLPREDSFIFGGAGSNGMKEDNTFVLKNVGAGVFRVNVFGLPDGFYVKSVKSGEIDIQMDGLDVTRGAPSPLDILVSPHAGVVSGTVQNPNTGQPASGALVVLVPEEKERRDQQQFYRTTTTDQNGSYLVKNIPPGEYKAFAWEDIDPGAYTDPEFLKPFESKGEAVTISESDQKSVSLTMIPAAAPPPAQ
jgi:hypothetical protein